MSRSMRVPRPKIKEEEDMLPTLITQIQETNHALREHITADQQGKLEIVSKLDRLESVITQAMPPDDKGAPDLFKHRLDHTQWEGVRKDAGSVKSKALGILGVVLALIIVHYLFSGKLDSILFAWLK